VRIADYRLIGPAVQIYTPIHPLDAGERRQKEFGKPVEIGSVCGSAEARSFSQAYASARVQ
jgi:acetyltransferase-like isoleucine patch superfamily enzyme